MTWPDVDAASRECVVLIPTGSLEQHGPHLPLFTDTLLASAAASAVENRLPSKVLLTPAIWLGASTHHLKFAGSLSATTQSYLVSLQAVVRSLTPHGFHKFFALNGHGGNTELNGIALRELKAEDPRLTLGHAGYFSYGADVAAKVMEGPFKHIRHACEAEASLMLYLHPELVRTDLLRDDGLVPEPPIANVIHHFDEMTEMGSFGYATRATAEKGKAIFEACVSGACLEIEAIADGYALVGIEPG